MKYLVLLLIVLGGVWWIRQQRQATPAAQKKTEPHLMLACTHCGTHVPDHDAVRGTRGVYCSEAHRHSHEG